jgi:chromodomain-helicase-DNA-binding protein 1
MCSHSAEVPNLEKFRFNIPLKPVNNWHCDWGQKEDAMLMAGIFKYGFGSWRSIREDTSLALAKKLSEEEAEEENTSAKQTAKVVRRAEYLLKVLREAPAEEESTPKKVRNIMLNNLRDL